MLLPVWLDSAETVRVSVGLYQTGSCMFAFCNQSASEHLCAVSFSKALVIQFASMQVKQVSGISVLGCKQKQG